MAPKVLLVVEFVQFDIFLLFHDIGIAYNKPHKDPPLVLMPAVLSYLQFICYPIPKITQSFTVYQYFHTV